MLLPSSVFVSVAEGQRRLQVGSEIRALLLFWLMDVPQRVSETCGVNV